MATFSNQELEFALESSNWSSMSLDSMEPPKKKKRIRARLDHMTPEEKRERRKEKNRQAAQTARDRKRTRLEKLEEENRRLREENMRLRGAILGNSRDQSIVDCPQTQLVSSPMIQITDSGVSDVDSKSGTGLSAYLNEQDNNNNNHHMEDRLGGGSDGRTMTPDSSCNYGTSVVSPASSSEDNLIDSIIERDNDIALVNEVRELVSYVNGDGGDGVSLGSAALINEPQQQVQGTSTKSQLAENSLGWTSVQLMLILMISRIHHRSSAKINCCQRVQSKSTDKDEVDPINCNLYDYILHTKCTDFRKAADAIISSKDDVRHQRLIALDFVQRYLCHSNFMQQGHKKGLPCGANNHVEA